MPSFVQVCIVVLGEGFRRMICGRRACSWRRKRRERIVEGYWARIVESCTNRRRRLSVVQDLPYVLVRSTHVCWLSVIVTTLGLKAYTQLSLVPSPTTASTKSAGLRGNKRLAVTAYADLCVREIWHICGEWAIGPCWQEMRCFFDQDVPYLRPTNHATRMEVHVRVT